MKILEQATIEELKVAAYDTLRLIEAYQAQLRAINERILTLENSQKSVGSEMKEPEKKEEVEAKK
jgi:uncharacterized coiled-coil protein SlyX